MRDLARLRDLIENEGEGEHGKVEHEILKESPMLGDGKFKLEIGTQTVRITTFVQLNSTYPGSLCSP